MHLQKPPPGCFKLVGCFNRIAKSVRENASVEKCLGSSASTVTRSWVSGKCKIFKKKKKSILDLINLQLNKKALGK